MATCTNTITTGSSFIELSSGVSYPSTINGTTNSVYILTSSLDQSVFFNLIVSGAPTIAITITIYYKNTLAVFGSTNITQLNTNSSFNITAGEYYVCIRAQILQYNITFKPTFISYNNTATFFPSPYFGYSSSTELYVKPRESACNRPLLFTLIDGALPTGLTFLDNGLIYGTLPMLDCDPYNDELSSSSSWYHKLSDSEYVTNWGRAYRFKVHLTLPDDTSKEDEAWFYISIVNNYDKNKAVIDSYEILDDEYLATFEEKIKLTGLKLCNPCTIIDDATDADDLKRIKNNEHYEKVINTLAEGEIDSIEFTSDFSDINESDNEMIIITDEYRHTSPEDFYIKYYNESYDMIVQLKDSCMFQHYLKQNNISDSYIHHDVLERFDYKNISIETIVLNDIKYLSLKNNIDVVTYDMNDKYNENYIMNLQKLPMTGYAYTGFISTGVLI